MPAIGERRTAWPRRRFSGTRFRVDAVYQRTVAELRARGSVLWLVFAPLARDATPQALREVVAEIDARAAGDQERTELYTAFLLMAGVDPWRHNLREELVKMVEDKEEGLRRRAPLIGDWIIEAEEKALKQGREEGQRAGREEGQRAGREEGQRAGREEGGRGARRRSWSCSAGSSRGG